MQENKTQYLQNAGNTVHCTVSVACPHHRTAAWEPWLAHTTRHHETVWHQISLAQRKIKIQTLKYGFHWMLIAFAPLSSQKPLSWTTVSRGLSVVNCSCPLCAAGRIHFSGTWSCAATATSKRLVQEAAESPEAGATPWQANSPCKKAEHLNNEHVI